jgi:hypothetical protein
MLLRRITKHVKDQNWFAVGIDFVIVVIGVFVGIQLGNWNEARHQQQSASAYIERLRDDLTANQDDFGQRLVYFTQVRDAGRDALRALDQPPETLGERFLTDVFNASQKLPREFGRDTYDEILSVGANNAISDVAVRKRLANHYRSIAAQLSNLKFEPPYREVIRRKLPYEVHKVLNRACGDMISTGPMGEPTIVLQSDCNPNLNPTLVSETVEKILNADIRDDLTRRVVDLDSKLQSIELVIERTVLLDEYLEQVE